MKRIAWLVLVACSSNTPGPVASGVEPTLGVGTLTPAQIEAVCDYGVSLSREVICNGNPTQSVTVKSACVGLLQQLAEGCVGTVGDLELCFEDSGALSDEAICALTTPDSCAFLGDASCTGL